MSDEPTQLRDALQSLVDRLDQIHDDPAFKSVRTVNQANVGPYTGPTYVEALDQARAVLLEVVGELRP
jgi:hypothetical protein